MCVIGGRTNTVGENVQLEIYETETSEWKKFNSLQRFRHSIWAIDQFVYMHGGFENETPNIPTNSIMKIDIALLLKGHPALLQKLEQHVGVPKDGKAKGDGTKSELGNSDSTSDKSRSSTPPLQQFAKENARIRIDRVEVEPQPGQQTRYISMPDWDKEKADLKQLNSKTDSKFNKPANSLDTLYSLFLNHLLRPREWTA